MSSRVRVRFEPTPGAAAAVVALPGARRVKRETAKAIVVAAEERAPVGDSGAYRRSLRWVDTDQVTAAVTTDMAGHLVEFGSVHNPTYSPLRNGAMSLGIRYVAASRA